MNIALFNTAFSAGAILIPANKVDETPCTATPEATAFAAVMADNGYGLDQKLFRALCHLEAADIAAINEAVEEKLQLKLNWMPLIKGWTTPTGATFFDALVAMFANVLPPLRDVEGVTLPCGHFIPKGTFPSSATTVVLSVAPLRHIRRDLPWPRLQPEATHAMDRDRPQSL